MKAISQNHQHSNAPESLRQLSGHVEALTKGCKQYDYKLSHFILWISVPLRSEVFFEIATILCLLRAAILISIWYTGQRDSINVKGDTVEIKLTPWTLLVKVTRSDIEAMNSLSTCGVCPLLGPKWNEVKKSSNGRILDRILPQVTSEKQIEVQFFEKVKELSEENNEGLSKITEAILNLKETELKESVKAKRKFSFLNWSTMSDLQELIQKLCDWMQYFNPEEFSLSDVDVSFTQISK